MNKYRIDKDIRKIRKFFGFDSKEAHLRKWIKVPPVTKLEYLEAYRQSICRLPRRIGKKVVAEMENRR